MRKLAESIAQQARALSTEERLWLAEELLATVQPSDPEIDAAWEDELKRRIAEIDAGTAALVSAEEVIAELRRIVS